MGIPYIPNILSRGCSTVHVLLYTIYSSVFLCLKFQWWWVLTLHLHNHVREKLIVFGLCFKWMNTINLRTFYEWWHIDHMDYFTFRQWYKLKHFNHKNANRVKCMNLISSSYVYLNVGISSHCHLSIDQVSLQSILYFPRYGPDKNPLWK